MTTETQLQPIVNGNFNHELTNDQMLAFDFETKKHMAWCLIVSMNFAHSFRYVDSEIFTTVPTKYTHDMITPESVDDILTTVRTEFQQRHKQLLFLTANLHHQQGKEIHQAQKRLGFGGFLEMGANKLKGYIQEIGRWNDFEHFRVIDAIQEMERLVPCFYMPNNPNNGMKKHKWAVCSDYITMKFSYLSGEDRKMYLDFYQNHFEPIASRVKADSIRYELTELGNGAVSLELIMWWD